MTRLIDVMHLGNDRVIGAYEVGESGVAESAMTNPSLTVEEVELLRQVVARRDPYLRTLAHAVTTGRVLTISEANALRDAIGDELSESGVDEGVGALNDRGKRLDALIDRVGALSALYDT
jgi:hypothetical protein